MIDREARQYTRIAQAIDYIKANFKQQPSLKELADAVHLSPYHFQRLFTDWAGVSPKKFVQFLSVEYAKQLLYDKEATVQGSAYETGLSGSSRLHDLFVNIEGMTPGEFRNGGEGLHINYCYAESPFGKLIVASTSKGICHMVFIEDEVKALAGLVSRFPNAEFHQVVDKLQQDALLIFQKDWSNLNQIKLHLNATPFQLRVWQTLLKIPLGNLTSYGEIARDLGKAGAARAVGSAIGSNPVAFLIPCHRVIRASGDSGSYRWGSTKKSAIIGWEASQLSAG